MAGKGPIEDEDSGMKYQNRCFQRYQVRWKGKILFAEEPCSIDCVIKNISEGGALICTRAFVPWMPNVLLWDEKTRSLHLCQIRWRKGLMTGLYFTDVRGRIRRRQLLEKSFVPLTLADGMHPTMH